MRRLTFRDKRALLKRTIDRLNTYNKNTHADIVMRNDKLLLSPTLLSIMNNVDTFTVVESRLGVTFFLDVETNEDTGYTSVAVYDDRMNYITDMTRAPMKQKVMILGVDVEGNASLWTERRG